MFGELREIAIGIDERAGLAEIDIARVPGAIFGIKGVHVAGTTIEIEEDDSAGGVAGGGVAGTDGFSVQQLGGAGGGGTEEKVASGGGVHRDPL